MFWGGKLSLCLCLRLTPSHLAATEILSGPLFLIATKLINLTLGHCNNLTC